MSHKQQGFSLMELLIVMVILGMLAGIVGPTIWKHLSKAQDKTAKTQISQFESAIDTYRLDMFKYPSSLDALINNTSNSPKWNGPYLTKRMPKDPWGNEYQYKKPGDEGRDYDLYSFGADGQEGGEDDIVHWQS